MTQVIDISASGNVTICANLSQCLIFAKSNPALPTDVADVLSGILSAAGDGAASVHLERRGSKDFTTTTGADGGVEWVDGVGASFDPIISSFARIDAALNPAPPAPDPAAVIRADRNLRLSASDWTQLADAQTDKTAWVAYRQALRDVPQQAGFPASVAWPAQPE